MNLARSLQIGLLWSGLLVASAGGQTTAAQTPPAVSTDAAEQQAGAARNAALEMLRARPWYAAFKSVIDETNTAGRDKIGPGFADAWSEMEALGEATRRIENGMKEGRPATSGAVNDAIELAASSLMARAGCFVALAQRAEFAPQIAHLAVLRVDGTLPESLRNGVKKYAQGPCEAPQSGGRFDARRAFEGGKKLLVGAHSGRTMPSLAQYLNDGDFLKTAVFEDPMAATRQAIDADFNRFDSLYDGHSELLSSYRTLFADYCPTDQRFCALRDILANWRKPEAFCADVTRFAASYYGDTARVAYFPGAENDGLNRAWEGYHLKFAPACAFLAKRPDLLTLISNRLDTVSPLFSGDNRVLGENGVARLRDEVRATQAKFENGSGSDARIKAYRQAAGLDTRVASVGGPAPSVAPATGAGAPSEAELREPGTEASERDLALDRGQVLEIQERLTAIGGGAAVTGAITNGTRSAIRSWQRAMGVEPTGYLTRAQFDLLKLRTQHRWIEWRASRDSAVEAPRSPRVRQQQQQYVSPPPRERTRRAGRGRGRGGGGGDEPYYIQPSTTPFGVFGQRAPIIAPRGAIIAPRSPGVISPFGRVDRTAP